MNCGSNFPWICLPYVCSHYLCLCLEVDQKAKLGMVLMVTAKGGRNSWSYTHRELNLANNHLNLEEDPKLQKGTQP